MYPAHAVGDADNNIETTRVATVTGQRSSPNQLEDLLRRVLTTAPKPEVPDVEKLLQQLVRETQCRPPAVVSPPVPTALEQMLRSFLEGQRQRQRPPPRQRPARRDWTNVVCFSCGKSGHAATCYSNLDESFPFLQPGWRMEKTPCTFCGTLIRCDMNRHVAHCHLELAQLWRCPVSWCTAGLDGPCLRSSQCARGDNIKKVSLETLFPPWTVTRQVYTDSLTSRHSGISNDMLLFSDIGLSLIHHYRVHKRGLPHVAFQRNYMSQLRALLPLPMVLPIEGGLPDPTCLSLPCAVESPDVVCASPRPSRRAIGRRRPIRVMESPVQIAPRLNGAGPTGCGGGGGARLPFLPGAMDVSGVDLAEI